MTARNIAKAIAERDQARDQLATLTGTFERERSRGFQAQRYIEQLKASLAQAERANAALRGQLQAANKQLAGYAQEAAMRHAYEEAGQ